MIFDDDLKNIINAEFSTEVAISQGENSATVNGIFDDSTVIEDNAGYKTPKREVRVILYRSDIGFDLDENALLTIMEETYHIKKIEPDKAGSIVVRLK